MLGFYRVQGDSLYPTVRDGDYVITWDKSKRISINSLLIISHPEHGTIIKRVASINSNGELLVSGENQLSTSSSSMGWIPPKQVLGRVFCQISKKKIRWFSC